MKSTGIKIVGSAHYVHKSNRKALYDKLMLSDDDIMFIESALLKYQEAVIIKYDKGALSLITSPDWDSANEPIVGRVYRWKRKEWRDGNGCEAEPMIRDNFKQVYHNKWQFVADDYKGFDIEEAKARTKEWNAIPGIDKVKNKIGYKEYWMELLHGNGMNL